MIHLSAIAASRLLGNNPNAKAVVNKVKKAQQVDELHSKVLAQLVGFPDPATELVFHPKRKWRLDYAWPTSTAASTPVAVTPAARGSWRTAPR